jgi:hypothetical protein
VSLRNDALNGVGFRSPGTLTVDNWGKAAFKFILPDGTVAAGASHISNAGNVRISIPLYRKNSGGERDGYLQGIATAATGALNGSITWNKVRIGDPEIGAPYRDGVAYENCTLKAQVYRRPATRQRVLSDLNDSQGAATFQLRNGNIATINHIATVDATNKVTVVDATQDDTNVNIDAAKGLFTGSFVYPGDGRVRKFRGVVLQGDNVLEGQFLGDTVAGIVQVHARAD